jgi:hypothetical protein
VAARALASGRAGEDLRGSVDLLNRPVSSQHGASGRLRKDRRGRGRFVVGEAMSTSPTGAWYLSWPYRDGMVVARRSVGDTVDGRSRVKGNPILAIASQPEGTAVHAVYPFGQLFALEGVEDAEERFPGGMLNGIAHGSCSRARIVAELPLWRAFGEHGREAVSILDVLVRMTPDDVARLAASVPEEEPSVIRPTIDALLDGHPGRTLFQHVVLRVHDELIALAPFDVMSREDIDRGKLRLGDPGWLRLNAVSIDALRVVLFPEFFSDSREASLDSWLRLRCLLPDPIPANPINDSWAPEFAWSDPADPDDPLAILRSLSVARVRAYEVRYGFPSRDLDAALAGSELRLTSDVANCRLMAIGRKTD